MFGNSNGLLYVPILVKEVRPETGTSRDKNHFPYFDFDVADDNFDNYIKAQYCVSYYVWFCTIAFKCNSTISICSFVTCC